MRTLGIITLTLLSLAAVSIGGCALGIFGSVADTVIEEANPKRLLEKYEMYKDMHARLSSKKESIVVLEASLRAAQEEYPDPSDRPRDVRQQISQNRAEINGLKISYNNLAADYNAAMAKVNYAFCNVGDLPKGASEPLPREYVQYLIN